MSAPGLAWQACLKKTKVELELLANIDMLLMVEKGIRGGIYQAIHSMLKQTINIIDIISPYLMHLDAKNLYGWVMSQNCL